MARTSQSPARSRKPAGRGRKKIAIERIPDKSKQQVTFSKRRTGMFKKAGELSVLCNAEIAIIIFSPGGKIFCFGHPNAEATINRYLQENNSRDQAMIPYGESIALDPQVIQAHNHHYERALLELENEKRTAKTEAQQRKNGGFWWEEPVDVEAMTAVELKQYMESLDELMNMVDVRAGELKAADTRTLMQSYTGDVPF